MNGQVAGYRGLVESLADRVYRPRMGLALAGRDDLVQEGLIFVWQTLQRGLTPSKDVIEKHMLHYRRWAGNKKNQPYALANPLEDYRDVLKRPEVSR